MFARRGAGRQSRTRSALSRGGQAGTGGQRGGPDLGERQLDVGPVGLPGLEGAREVTQHAQTRDRQGVPDPNSPTGEHLGEHRERDADGARHVAGLEADVLADALGEYVDGGAVQLGLLPAAIRSLPITVCHGRHFIRRQGQGGFPCPLLWKEAQGGRERPSARCRYGGRCGRRHGGARRDGATTIDGSIADPRRVRDTLGKRVPDRRRRRPRRRQCAGRGRRLPRELPWRPRPSSRAPRA